MITTKFKLMSGVIFQKLRIEFENQTIDYFLCII